MDSPEPAATATEAQIRELFLSRKYGSLAEMYARAGWGEMESEALRLSRHHAALALAHGFGEREREESET